jgi:hypothetical protein
MRCASRSRLRLSPDTEWFARKGLQVLIQAIRLSGTVAHGARGQVYTDDPGQETPMLPPIQPAPPVTQTFGGDSYYVDPTFGRCRAAIPKMGQYPQ